MLADRDLHALHSVADWIKTFVARPHKDLGRGAVAISGVVIVNRSGKSPTRQRLGIENRPRRR